MREDTSERPYFPWVLPFLLLLVQRRGTYGQDLTRSVAQLDLGAMPPRTVYRNLRRMEQEGMVLSERDGSDCRLSRRRYSITELGEAYLESCASSLAEYREAMDLLLNNYAGEAIRGVHG